MCIAHSRTVTQSGCHSAMHYPFVPLEPIAAAYDGGDTLRGIVLHKEAQLLELAAATARVDQVVRARTSLPLL